MRRRRTKNLRDEIREIDYLDRLSPEERVYMLQFLHEYYQADFSFEKPIHPQHLVKDCRDRNNASKRQVHSVGSEILDASVRKVREAQYNSRLANRYYTPEDHVKYQEGEEDEEPRWKPSPDLDKKNRIQLVQKKTGN